MKHSFFPILNLTTSSSDIFHFQNLHWFFVLQTCLRDFTRVINWLNISTKLYSYILMRSSQISLKSNMWCLQFSIWLKCSFGEVHFAENPTWIGSVVSKLWAIEDWRILWTKEKTKIFIHFLALSRHQCSRLPTDSDRSQHTWRSKGDYNGRGNINASRIKHLIQERVEPTLNITRTNWIEKGALTQCVEQENDHWNIGQWNTCRYWYCSISKNYQQQHLQ